MIRKGTSTTMCHGLISKCSWHESHISNGVGLYDIIVLCCCSSCKRITALTINERKKLWKIQIYHSKHKKTIIIKYREPWLYIDLLYLAQITALCVNGKLNLSNKPMMEFSLPKKMACESGKTRTHNKSFVCNKGRRMKRVGHN